jgi:hypothetical protein
MEDSIKEFWHQCERTTFGRITFSKMEYHFYCRFNKAMKALCRSLPEPVQLDAIFFLINYSGPNPDNKLEFFTHFYAPAWSILFWLNNNYTFKIKRSEKEDVANAVKAQAMAMFLHSIDNHITDNQIPASPLILLLRSQAWTILIQACSNLTKDLPGGRKKIQKYLDDYYSSIQESTTVKSLDSYCDNFRKQMAIGMAAPILLSMRMNRIPYFIKDIEIAYGSFGIAWRLLDDIQDIKPDIKKRKHTAIYFCLTHKMRKLWDSVDFKSRIKSNGSLNIIVNHILEHNLLDKIKERICSELEAGASIVEAYDLHGLAREFRCLAHPLRNSGYIWEENYGI